MLFIATDDFSMLYDVFSITYNVTHYIIYISDLDFVDLLPCDTLNQSCTVSFIYGNCCHGSF